jgi:rhodanese-related sulfurtransferase/DNA-binding transcriptional ArsR family regulator
MTDARREMFGYLAETAGVLASPSRIELLDLLAQGERSVEELSEASRLSIANASQHLQQLRRAGVVSRRRKGRQILYDLADERVLDLMAILRGMAESNHAAARRTVDHWYHARDPLAPVTRDELKDRLTLRSVRLIDVRPEIEYRAAHIPGALSIPVIALPERLEELPKRPEIVAYCRGPYCVMAYKAVEILRPVGYRARRLDGGFTEWRRAGLPLVRGETQPPALSR